jgi:hypothetical protein
VYNLVRELDPDKLQIRKRELDFGGKYRDFVFTRWPFWVHCERPCPLLYICRITQNMFIIMYGKNAIATSTLSERQKRLPNLIKFDKFHFRFDHVALSRLVVSAVFVIHVRCSASADADKMAEKTRGPNFSIVSKLR